MVYVVNMRKPTIKIAKLYADDLSAILRLVYHRKAKGEKCSVAKLVREMVARELRRAKLKGQ